MLLDNFSDLFQRGLEYAWDCESLLLKQIPEMADAASSGQVKQALQGYRADAGKQAAALERIFAQLGRSPSAERHEPIRMIMEECERQISHLDPSALLDAALVFAASQMAHYEIGLYRSLAGFARTLGMNDIATALEKILADEKNAADRLTQLAETTVNPAARGVHNAPPFALI
jgi:ferritin-like metal-binding protein YciE